MGREVAARLGWTFVDADDHHPTENIERMRSGLPLTEGLREPWLARLSTLVGRWIAQARRPVRRPGGHEDAGGQQPAAAAVSRETTQPALSEESGESGESGRPAKNGGITDAGAPRAALTGTVLACSALRRAHRETLASGRKEVWFAFLNVSPVHLRARLAARTGHFMQAALLESQLRSLEPPGPDEPVWIIPGDGTIEETVNLVFTRLAQRLPGPTRGTA